jgi:hypothetical protein
LNTEKYTNAQVAEIVEDEGLDYTVTERISADKIEDLALAALWRTAKESLDAINRFLFNLDEVDDEGPEDGI